MINVNITKDSFREFEVSGHGGGVCGEDIVCAAISALSQNVLVGLESLENLEWHYSMKDGYIKVEIDGGNDIDKAEFLVSTTLNSIKQIAEEYKDKIEVKENDV